MKLIKPNDLEQINKLGKNEIAFPDIKYTDDALIRTKTTLKAAYTNIIQSNASIQLEDLEKEWNPKGDIVWQNKMLNILQENIFVLIQEYTKSKDEVLLRKIFVYIQLWGGNTSRGFFLRNGGFKTNFNEKVYLKSIELINENDFSEALKELLKLEQMGISFATKHLFFWGNGLFPIYDNIIAMMVFGRKPQNSLLHYSEYVNALKTMSNKKSKCTSTIERTLFNWADTPDGQKWLSSRKNSI